MPETVQEAAITAPGPSNEPSKPALPQAIRQEDQMFLEMAKMKRQLAYKDAQKALAENRAAEIELEFRVLQLYIKYGLNAQCDQIDENGNIHRNAMQKANQ